MIEVVRRIANHPDFLHYPPRTHISRHGKRDDFAHPQCLERVMQYGVCRLGRQTLSPVVRSQTPSDLKARCEVRFKRWFREAGESDEFFRLTQFSRKQGESVVTEMH